MVHDLRKTASEMRRTNNQTPRIERSGARHQLCDYRPELEDDLDFASTASLPIRVSEATGRCICSHATSERTERRARADAPDTLANGRINATISSASKRSREGLVRWRRRKLERLCLLPASREKVAGKSTVTDPSEEVNLYCIIVRRKECVCPTPV